MRKAGYDDVERGERGSSEEHLTVTQFKVQQEQARLESIEDTIDRRKQTLEKYNEKIREQKGAAASFHEIDSIGKKTISGNISMTPQDAQFLKELAKEGVASRGLIGDLKNKVETLKRDVSVWKRKYEKLQEQTNDFMAALKRAPRKVKKFESAMLHHFYQRSNIRPLFFYCPEQVEGFQFRCLRRWLQYRTLDGYHGGCNK